MLRLFAAVLVSSLLSTNAVAQKEISPGTAATKEAGVHFGRGTTLYNEGDFGAALGEFQRAYELSPRWQVLFNIGQSYFQLRDYANALRALRRFASEGGDRIAAEDRATLDAELPELATRVAKVTILSNLDGATVWVDDQRVGTTPLSEPVLVSAGQRRIHSSREGRAPVDQRLTIVGGDASSVRLDFRPPETTAASPRLAADSRPAARPAEASRVPAYASLVVGAVGLAVGGTFGLLAIQEKANLDRVCSANGACPSASSSDINSLTRDGTISTVGFGVGIAGAAAGLVLWLISQPQAERRESPHAQSGGEDRPRELIVGPGFVAGSF